MFRAFLAHCARAGVIVAGAVLAGAVLLSGLVGCADGSSATPEDDTAGALQGELAAVSVLGSDGTSSMEYFLRVAGRPDELRLIFAVDPNLPSQTQLRVWGVEEGGAWRVTRHALVEAATPDIAFRGAALIGQPSVQRTVAWVQMDVNGGGVAQTKADASRLIFDQNPGPLFGTKVGDKSVVQYYDENSYGMLKLTGQVEGPIAFSGTACNNFDPLAMDVVGKVTALGRTYQHYYLYWGSMQSCGPGWGAQGTKARPGKYVWLNSNGTFCTATGQEIGHNFGLMHASTMDCGTAIIANDTSTCTSNEYGNPMTVMGGGCRHLISVEKWYSGFFQGCNAVKVKSSATVTLLPIELACNGVQAIQIQMPAAAPTRTTSTAQSNGNVTIGYYYLELRGGQGMDTGLKVGVYVHAAPDIPAPTANGPRTFMLDMNPATTAFDPMAAGQTFTDPAGGVSFTLDSFDQNKATVRVDITGGTGANTCVDGTTLAGTGPDSCGAASGGTGGAGGAAGTGGAGGVGAGGTGGGAGGAGGATGTGGAGGAGAGGNPGGAGGAGGAGGPIGTDASTGPVGTGGGGVSGSGSGGSAGGSILGRDAGAGSRTPGAVTGGCSCELGAAPGRGGWGSAPGLALVVAGLGLVVGRRRKPRS